MKKPAYNPISDWHTDIPVQFVSGDPTWSKALCYVKSIELDPFCHTLRLTLFNAYDWAFKPRKSAKFNYTQNGKKHTLTIFPKILLSSVTTPPPDTGSLSWTTFTLYARQKTIISYIHLRRPQPPVHSLWTKSTKSTTPETRSLCSLPNSTSTTL